MSIEFVAPDEIESADDTPGVDRKVAFQTEDTVMVQSRVVGGTATDWHHHGARHVYGYLLEGRAVVEFGPDGKERVEAEAPGFFHVPPGTVHRDRNPAETDQVSVVCFVGEGPLVENLDGPGSD